MAKKTVTVIPDDTRSALQQILEGEVGKGLLKKFGAQALGRADHVDDYSSKRLPSGVFPLDYALNGGYPVGRISINYGMPGASKTSTYLRVIGKAQKSCANCWTPANEVTGEIGCSCNNYREPVIAFINVEQTLHSKWNERLGVDMSKMLYSQPEYGEPAIEIVDRLIREAGVDIVLLDSIASMVPAYEVTHDATSIPVGKQPFLVGQAMRKFINASQYCETQYGYRPTILLTNQIREKPTMFGNPEVMPGGKAPPFFASVIVRMQAGKIVHDTATESPLLQEMTFRVMKNKSGVTGKEGGYQLVLGEYGNKKLGDVYDEVTVIKLAERLGMLDKVGNKWTLLDREFSKKESVEDAIIDDKLFGQAVRGQLMSKLLEREA